MLALKKERVKMQKVPGTDREIQYGKNPTTHMHTIVVSGEGQVSLSDAELTAVIVMATKEAQSEAKQELNQKKGK